MLTPGQQVDRYIIEAPLGEGGAATVYRVRHAVLGSRHALKVLQSRWARDDRLRARFLGEGRILAQLRHPNLLAITDVVVEPGVAGLVGELLEGEPLDERLDRDGALPEAESLAIVQGVLAGLACAHAAGIVHRDIKPANIFLSRDSDGRLRPVVLDFGIAKLTADSLVEHQRHKTTRMAIGTPGYMAPEQITTPAAIDHRVDIFAMGVLLYELLTGDAAFGSDSEFEVSRRIVDGDHSQMVHLDSLPASLREAVTRALEVNPAARFADCQEFAVALQSRGAAPPLERARSRGIRRKEAAPKGKDEGSRRMVLLLLLLISLGLAYLANQETLRSVRGTAHDSTSAPRITVAPLAGASGPPRQAAPQPDPVPGRAAPPSGRSEQTRSPALPPPSPPLHPPSQRLPTPSEPLLPSGCSPSDTPVERLGCLTTSLRPVLDRTNALHRRAVEQAPSMSERLVLRGEQQTYQGRVDRCLGSVTADQLVNQARAGNAASLRTRAECVEQATRERAAVLEGRVR
jgi:serine/threonine protein kinase